MLTSGKKEALHLKYWILLDFKKIIKVKKASGALNSSVFWIAWNFNFIDLRKTYVKSRKKERELKLKRERVK